MKIREQNSSYYKTAALKEQFPAETLPEIAFAGKSNVGKSSLINMLLGHKGLAHTSSTPGKTQTINWYLVDGQLYFVDLPGYGFARASKKDQERWSRTIEEYLHERRVLKKVLLLVDIRHEPGDNDHLMARWLAHYDVPVILAATKCDKLKKSEIERQLASICKELAIPRERALAVSSLTKEGKDALWKMILRQETPSLPEE